MPDDSLTIPVPATWRQKSWIQNLLVAIIAVAGVYGLIYWDVVSRSREAYHEGEKYLEWHYHPEKKKEFFEKKFILGKGKLDQQLAKKTISDEEYKRKIDALEFDKAFSIEESSLKYAYQWYKDTYELFSPPESRWVKMARAKAPETLALWKQELTAQNVPFEDYMFE